MQQSIEALQVQLTAISNQVDQFGNSTVLIGNLNQTVLVGADASHTGVYVGTGIGTPTAPVAGIAWRENTVATTITKTGASAGTVASASGLVNGMVCGAAQVAGVSAIVPGTTFTITGTAVTLSIPWAVTAATSIYFVACNWYQLSQLTVP